MPGKKRKKGMPAALELPEQGTVPETLGPEAQGEHTTAESRQVIGPEQVAEAVETLQEYKKAKANLEAKIIENEQWFKMRHWEQMKGGGKSAVEPASGWLFNCLVNKHADAMDNYPASNILPREEGDKQEAERLTAIIPVVKDRCDFEQTYSDVWDYKLKNGTGVYGTFWDQTAMNGMGDICIRQVDLLNLFWEPGIKDVQLSRNMFEVELRDNDLLVEEYPQLEGKLGSSSLEVSEYIYDDTVDTSKKSAVVDWYYKKRSGSRTVLHYCKFVNGELLFASENEAKYAEQGWYHHGLYPFDFDPLFRMEGSPCGFGYIDVGKSAQEYIDRGNQAIMQNMLANARPRHFIRKDGAVNEEEYADMTKDFVHVDGNLGQDSVMPIQGKPLNGIYVQVIRDKVDELKETTGNRDISTGGSASGVTAASAIAAMQEAGSKLSRDHIKASYRCTRRIDYKIIELIRQFYDLPRSFRILGKNGEEDYVSYTNDGIVQQHQGVEFGMDMGYRVPQFDIEVTTQKQSPYSKMSQNELALQFYSAGFFNPQLADQSMACLEMMDFDRKQFIMKRVAQNGGMYQQMMAMQQQMMQMAQMLDAYTGGNFTAQAAQVAGAGAAPMPSGGGADQGAKKTAGESSITEKARQRVADSTAPT